MIAIDLSPIVFDPRRGVARALEHLLLGLREVAPRDLEIRAFAPPWRPGAPRLEWARAALAGWHEVGAPDLLRSGWRRALASAIEQRGATVLLSPWARFPRTRVRVVAWIHEVPFARHGLLEGGLRTLRHRQALARAADRAAALVVPSEAVRSDLLHVHPQVDRRTHVVAHGFDPEPWRERAARLDVPTFGGYAMLGVRITTVLPDSTGLRGPGSYALLVGTGRGAGGPRKKGVDVFVRAFKGGQVAGLDACVVGAVPDVPGHVFVLEDVTEPLLKWLVHDARVVVVPSRSEGFGYPMLEAFAAGVPVVASAAGALPEVSGGAARLVPPGDADALREAIERVATDEDLRARMIKDGKKRAQEFPVAAMARGWLRVLTKVGGIPWRG